MKKVIIITLMFNFGFFSTVYPAQELTLDQIEYKYEHYKKKKIKGMVLLIGGITLLPIGIGITAANSDDLETESTAGQVSVTGSEPGSVIGIMFIIGSIPLAVVGGIFTGLGSSKEAEYKKMYDEKKAQLSIKYNMDKEELGFFLTGEF